MRSDNKLMLVGIISVVMLLALIAALSLNSSNSSLTSTAHVVSSEEKNNYLNLYVTEQGSIKISPINYYCNDECSLSFSNNEELIIFASPSQDSAFLHWSGSKECNGKISSELKLRVNRNISCTAVFT